MLSGLEKFIFAFQTQKNHLFFELKLSTNKKNLVKGGFEKKDKIFMTFALVILKKCDKLPYKKIDVNN